MGITRPETLVQEALAPKKMAEAQHAAMGTRTRSPRLASALPNAPQKDAILEDRARFPKRENIMPGQTDEGSRTPMPEASHDQTLPRSPYARQHDAMRCCCHAHGPRYCLPLLPHHCYHSATTALLRTATACCAYGRTPMTSHCCCLAAADHAAAASTRRLAATSPPSLPKPPLLVPPTPSSQAT